MIVQITIYKEKTKVFTTNRVVKENTNLQTIIDDLLIMWEGDDYKTTPISWLEFVCSS